MSELKPCPFCGATPRVKAKNLGTETVYVIDQLHYSGCYLDGFREPDNQGYVSPEAAIKAWNRRADDERD